MNKNEIEKCALCIGHPGHELRVYGWMLHKKPLVSVITDGSGPNRLSRFPSTGELVLDAGGKLGSLKGAYTDRAFYQLMEAGDAGPFIELASGLANEWEAEGIEVVAGDMCEGFSTTHDVCRVIINAAVRKLASRGRMIRNLEFALDSMQMPEMSPGSEMIRLEPAQFERKRWAAIETYPEMASEVERVIERYGEDAFSVEILVTADADAGLSWDHEEPPFYETYGRKQVEAGHYQTLITFRDHIQPLSQAIYEWAGA